MNKTIVLIQAHGGEDYIYNMALRNKDTMFIIHFDAKYELDRCFIEESKKISNLLILPEKDRVKVYWGGSSQLKATLNLLSEAVSLGDFDVFHFISGECFPLYNFSEIEKMWRSGGELNHLECKKREDVEWRLKVKVFYSNSNFTRTVLGRCFNLLHKLIGRYFNPCQWDRDRLWYGSCWFTIKRELANKIVHEHKYNNYFKQFDFKPCVDEHAIQVFVNDFKIVNVNSDIKRYIYFSHGKSSPVYISDLENKDIHMYRSKGFWFVRKVNSKIAIDSINKI